MSLRALLICVFVNFAAADEPWTPPENPNPSAILNEAQADTRAKKYEQALAKHVWFHRHALQYQPSQSGVRLSFALMYWKRLADDYPLALVKLIEIRDEAAASALEGKEARSSIQDLAAINKYLGEETRTKDVFVRLHNEKPDIAKVVFSLARPALIKAKEFQLCGNYLDPDLNLRQAIDAFAAGKRLAQNPQFGERHLDFANRSFTNQTATLVALLAVNGRRTEAETAAAGAKNEWNDAAFHRAIDDALKGNVPVPWP